MTGGNRVAETSIPNNYRQSALSSITHTLHDTFIRHRTRARERGPAPTRADITVPARRPRVSRLSSLSREEEKIKTLAHHTHTGSHRHRLHHRRPIIIIIYHRLHRLRHGGPTRLHTIAPHRHTASHHRFELFVIIVNQSLSIKRVIVFPHIRCLKATVLNRQHRRTGPFLSHSLICRAATFSIWPRPRFNRMYIHINVSSTQ